MALPKIEAIITANTSDAEAGFKRVSEGIGGVQGASQKAISSVKAFAIGLASVAAVAGVFTKSASEAQKFETTMFRINAVIKATGGVAGKTADELRASARNLALNTLESTEGVLAAQQRLLTFRKVQGDVFDRAINAVADLSAVLGQDMSTGAIQLGRALEDPVAGISALARSGTVFTASQKEMVKGLVESGKLMEAQSFILDELEAQYGGAAVAAAKGLAGAYDTLGQMVQEFLLAIDEAFGVSKLFTVVLNSVSAALAWVNEGVLKFGDFMHVLYSIVGDVASVIRDNFSAALTYMGITSESVSAALERVNEGVSQFGDFMYGIYSIVKVAASLIKDGLGAALAYVGITSENVSAALSWLWKNVRDAFSWLSGIIADNPLVKMIASIFSAIKTFGQLAMAVGTSGEAFDLLKDVGVEAVGRIKDAFGLVPAAIKAGSFAMQEYFLTALRNMLQSFQDLTWSVAEGLNSLFGTNLQGARIGAISDGPMGGAPLDLAIRDAMYGRKAAEGEVSDIASGLTAPLESVQKIRDLLAGMKDDEVTLPDILGVGGDATSATGDAGGGKDKKTLDEKLTEQEKRIKDHLDRIKALTKGTLSDKLGAWGDYFGSLIQLTGTQNAKMLAVQKSFAAAQALIDAYTAYNQVLADPTLPWFAKFAAAGQVLAAGIGAVNAIRSINQGSTGGGSSGGGGRGGGAGAAAASNVSTLDVNLTVQGRGDLATSPGAVDSLTDMLLKNFKDRGLDVVRVRA